jgi:hypothetical protein
LGHVFLQVYPGNTPGITVVVPDGEATRVLGPFPGGSVDVSTQPFTIRLDTNDCAPTCAGGHHTTSTLHWSAPHGDYR